MSETVIFGVGIVVFALTIWGTVMAGGYLLGEIAATEDDRPQPGEDPSPSPPESSTPS
jgi:hypothetical protein